MSESTPGRKRTPQPICGGCGYPIWGAVEQRELTARHAGGQAVCDEVGHATKYERLNNQNRYDAEKRQFASWLGIRP